MHLIVRKTIGLPDIFSEGDLRKQFYRPCTYKKLYKDKFSKIFQCAIDHKVHDNCVSV